MRREWDTSEPLMHFLAVRNIAEATREALSDAIIAEMTHRVRRRHGVHMQEALDYLAEVREGFTLSMRTEASRDIREWMYLLNRLLTDWSWLTEMGIDLPLPENIERVGRQLIAFAMAAIALAFTPELPREAVTFPLRHFFPTETYADIPAPRSPAEMWDRLEEIEQVIYAAGIKPLSSLPPSPLRRAYAFFEANAWLADQHLTRFLGKAS